MRILFVHPNYRSGGAEIAGNWPPAWVAYLSGSLRRAGFDDIHFIDAMTNDFSDEVVAEKIAALQPDVVVDMLQRAGAESSRPEGLAEEFGLHDDRYRLTDRQAQAILDLRLHKLTGRLPAGNARVQAQQRGRASRP